MQLPSIKRSPLLLPVFGVALLCVARLASQPLAPIRYTLSFPAPQTHYVEVEAAIPTDGQAQVDLMMPVWTPGSYLVREYARNVESISATGAGGAPLRIEKTRKNRWRVAANGTPVISLRYRVYGREMSVRTNWIDDEFAQLNGAATFITRLEVRDRSYEVRLQRPAGWARSLSGMSSPEADVYQAADYDTLVDSPIIAGNPAVYEFTAGGKPHALVDIGEAGIWDGARAVRDLARIAQQTIDMWGVVPYERFFFFNVIGSPTNGLEHKNSIVMNTPRLSTATATGYRGWLSLASHEFMHPWNVKRLRPIELGPFDYENEVYTKGLWFAEGVSDYYADLAVHRSGVTTRDEYLQDLSSQIASLQGTPGRLVQPLEQASYDAWIKYYRSDENTPNSSISYYTKGAVVGFLLDAKIRRDTAGARTLDDLMRLMYQRYSGARGFTSDDLRQTAADLVGPAAQDMRRWLQQALETTDELDYRDAVDWFGLAFRAGEGQRGAFLGVGTRVDGDRTIVTQVRRGTPAYQAGFDADDELIAIDDVRLPAGQLTARLAQLAPGDKVTFTIARHDRVRRLDVTLAPNPGPSWDLIVQPGITPEQSAHLKSWLHD